MYTIQVIRSKGDAYSEEVEREVHIPGDDGIDIIVKNSLPLAPGESIIIRKDDEEGHWPH